MASNFYADQLQRLTSDPNSFSGTPGFQFALNNGLGAISRRMPGGRGSGGELAALTKYGTGLASQDYGNYFDRLLAAKGQTDQTNLGNDRLSLDQELGRGNLDLGRGRLALDDRMGTGRLALENNQLGETRRSNDMNFGLGAYRAGNDYNLGMANVNANREGRWWDYTLGRDQLAGNQANNENTSNLNWFNAQTQRGNARSNDYYAGQRNRLAWRNAPQQQFGSY